jgi:2-methylaconitate cis-trans-isomerase PrpF
MTQIAIPFLFMRGGTSRGPYLNRADLPDDLDTLAEVLIAVVGSGDPLNIDGIGGGNAVTTKVAMLSRSANDWADIDYFFAQVSVMDRTVDFKPTCGNILSGVGPAAIEMGLVDTKGDETTVNIHAVNTGARVVATVKTSPNGVVYAGDATIDGVSGTAAPVALQFMDTVGGATGAFLPTGNLVDTFYGVDVTCMDVAMPMVIARAEAFGLTGYESAEALNNNVKFFAIMETVRIQAGKAMGIKDVASSVTPKFGLLAPSRDGGTVAVRYFMPWKAHPTMAVTGAQCLASCVLTPGTVADGLAARSNDRPATVTLEHASGKIDVIVDYDLTRDGINLRSAGLVRTARLLARGEVMIPSAVWSGK